MDHKDLYLRKSFAISHNDGQMWAANLDALGDHPDVLLRRWEEDIAVLLRPSSPGVAAVNLCQTAVSAQQADRMMADLQAAGPRVTRVAFIGADRAAGKNLRDAAKRQGATFVHQYFKDFVVAKDWLIPPRGK